MAKKRSSRASSTRSSSRGRRAKGGAAAAGAGWKKSKPLAAILIVLIVGSIASIISESLSGGSSSMIPDNFPRTYIAEEDNGNYAAVLIKRGQKDTPVPFEENGKKYWEAYICLNEHCPGRKKGDPTPYIFAGVHPEITVDPAATPENPGMPPEGMYYEISCPKCKERYEKVSKKYKSRYDPMNYERYMTDEAKEIIKKIREEYKKRQGK